MIYTTNGYQVRRAKRYFNHCPADLWSHGRWQSDSWLRLSTDGRISVLELALRFPEVST